MGALHAFAAIAATSVAQLDKPVTLPQLRVLVMINAQGPLNISAVAGGLGVNPSNASRTCDRLVRARLLDRQETPSDRRNMTLSLTQRGQEFVDAITEYRRDAIEEVLGTMTPSDLRAVITALSKFAQAAGVSSEYDALALLGSQNP
ncbi:MarR family winged helix-turn-helix transcriptional regulator [Mycobacteroides abscessus]|uniref:MarR family winged helix-turn-helix transcriptional regulator n=1 Tax=Mycobacteroides abscessus TaxID=36809 RepID=UPI0009A78FC0|nr:MarR family transcriptional regulator [Mycobacteroides abscessus]SLF47491.1 transcriptional regulator [Mycobacteroides abscessus subsp. abscessus]